MNDLFGGGFFIKLENQTQCSLKLEFLCHPIIIRNE